MDSRKHEIRMVPIDAAMRERFERNAPAALARRPASWFVEAWLGTGELLLVATVSLVGLLLLGWSAAAMLGLLLVSAAIGFCGDFLKGLLLRRQLAQHFQALHQDIEVWAVASVLLEGKDEVRADHVRSAQMGAGCGLMLDLCFGGMAVVAMVVVLHRGGISLVEPFVHDATMRNLLLGLVAFQVASLSWQLFEHTLGGRANSAVQFQAGGRGIGLFLLMFIVLFAVDDGGSLRTALVVANGALLGLGLVAVFGMGLVRRETQWLRAHLRARR
ncbi:MAG TPA: hypothetical protein VFG21_04755 [Xanthomonadaceae bacterium]|nr:hypothetical protein [Xanthomonadaceae bacterium]